MAQAGDLVAHDFGGTLQPETRDGRRDEDERRRDQDARGADPLQNPCADRTDDESAERAEQRELRVESRVALLLLDGGVRPSGAADVFGVLAQLVRARHLGHQGTARHDVELGRDQDQERQRKEPERVQVLAHHPTEHRARDRRHGDEDSPPVGRPVDQRSEQRRHHGERGDRQQEIEQDARLRLRRRHREEQ